MSRTRPDVSIVIKALNEERHIAAAIESALAALDGIDGEVIVADSASTDRTVEIAAKYPIKIVRLSRVEDRSCGAGVQLAYQYSRGRYVYLLDGDMRLRKEFISAGIQFLEEHPDFAGVGGIIFECETHNFEYVKRATARDAGRGAGEVSRLNCGGLYRREAIDAAGYFGDRNLHSAEEFELAVRLRARGWKLARIDVPAIDHYGHAENPYAMLRRRWVTRFAFGPGEILRAALAHDRLGLTLKGLQRQISLLAAVHFWWICLIAALFITRARLQAWTPALIATATLAILPFVGMSLRCRSLNRGIYSVVAWNVYALGVWPGLFQRRVNPAAWIDSTVVRAMPASPTPTRIRALVN
jgi:glycosyltransferase involved in cell wall biosynthesis